jgi:hypothetical protein
MRQFTLRWGGLFVATIISGIALAQTLRRPELREGPHRMPGEEELHRVIKIGPGVTLKASIEVTSKGNGLLTIGNLQLRVVDSHDDGAKYQDGMAHVEFADVDGDGWKDLIVIGIAEFTDEKSAAVLKREPFTFFYKYDPRTGKFRETFRLASFELRHGMPPM